MTATIWRSLSQIIPRPLSDIDIGEIILQSGEITEGGRHIDVH